MTFDNSLPLTLKPSWLKITTPAGIAALFTVCGLWLASDQPFIGRFCVGVFVLCLIVSIAQLLPNSSYLRLTPEGFTFCCLFRRHTLRWNDVGEFVVVRVLGNRMVAWNFSVQYKAQPRTRALSLAIAGVEGSLPDTYGMKAEDLADLLNRLRGDYA